MQHRGRKGPRSSRRVWWPRASTTAGHASRTTTVTAFWVEVSLKEDSEVKRAAFLVMLLRRWHFPWCPWCPSLDVMSPFLLPPAPGHDTLGFCPGVSVCQRSQEGVNISHTLCIKPAFPQHHRHLVLGSVPTSNQPGTALFVPQGQWSSEWECQRGCPSGPWKSDRAVRVHITGNEDRSFPTALELSLTPSCQWTELSISLFCSSSLLIWKDSNRLLNIINCFYWLKKYQRLYYN